MKERVEEELEKLEKQGVWKRVVYSKWVAPIVPVQKDVKDPKGPVRICGDYKVTVNKVAPLDTYPIPSVADQLATFKGGKKFSKIDLKQAYQQLENHKNYSQFQHILGYISLPGFSLECTVLLEYFKE